MKTAMTKKLTQWRPGVMLTFSDLNKLKHLTSEM